MAFTFTKDNDGVAGDMRITSGSYTGTGATTGGDIYTGLQQIQGIILQQYSSAVVGTAAVVNATFPRSDPVAIVTVAAGDGSWMAWGY